MSSSSNPKLGRIIAMFQSINKAVREVAIFACECCAEPPMKSKQKNKKSCLVEFAFFINYLPIKYIVKPIEMTKSGSRITTENGLSRSADFLKDQ